LGKSDKDDSDPHRAHKNCSDEAPDEKDENGQVHNKGRTSMGLDIVELWLVLVNRKYPR
jgi:hypothetical protein